MSELDRPEEPLDWASVARPCTGERVSGDLAHCHRLEDRMFLAVIDSLGHGPRAHEVALRAAEVLKDPWGDDPGEILGRLHEGLRGTDGAVATVAILDVPTGRLRCAGVGNVSLVLMTDAAPRARLANANGVLGQRMRSVTVQEFVAADRDLILLHSDGVSSSFGAETYPQARYQSCRAIAKTLIRRFGRDHDDATCLVTRFRT
jgi:hypothetical protein